jgi:mannose/fructose/N-acetylgalactosamine-specific phosphotransferase system component IIC
MSLFKCRVLLGVGAWVLGLGAIGAAAAVAYPDLDAGQLLGTRALIGYAIFAAATVFLGIPFAMAAAILNDFVVPLMAVRQLRVVEAWGACRAEVLSGNIGSVVLFYLLRILLAVGIAIAMEILKYMTCCISTIPYLGTVLLLPIFVFHRAYPLYFMEQLGVGIFPRPEGSWAAYDQWRFPR